MIYFICFVFIGLVLYNIYLQIHEIKQNKVIKQLNKDNSLLVRQLKAKQDLESNNSQDLSNNNDLPFMD